MKKLLKRVALMAMAAFAFTQAANAFVPETDATYYVKAKGHDVYLNMVAFGTGTGADKNLVVDKLATVVAEADKSEIRFVAGMGDNTGRFAIQCVDNDLYLNRSGWNSCVKNEPLYMSLVGDYAADVKFTTNGADDQYIGLNGLTAGNCVWMDKPSSSATAWELVKVGATIVDVTYTIPDPTGNRTISFTLNLEAGENFEKEMVDVRNFTVTGIEETNTVVSTNNKTFTVNGTWNIPFTVNEVYRMKLRGGTQYWKYDGTNIVTNDASDAVAFVQNRLFYIKYADFVNNNARFTVHTIAEPETKGMNSANNVATVVDTPTKYIYESSTVTDADAAAVFSLRSGDTESNTFYLDEQSSKVSIWNSSWAKNNDGSTMRAYALADADFTADSWNYNGADVPFDAGALSKARENHDYSAANIRKLFEFDPTDYITVTVACSFKLTADGEVFHTQNIDFANKADILIPGFTCTTPGKITPTTTALTFVLNAGEDHRLYNVRRAKYAYPTDDGGLELDATETKVGAESNIFRFVPTGNQDGSFYLFSLGRNSFVEAPADASTSWGTATFGLEAPQKYYVGNQTDNRYQQWIGTNGTASGTNFFNNYRNGDVVAKWTADDAGSRWFVVTNTTNFNVNKGKVNDLIQAYNDGVAALAAMDENNSKRQALQNAVNAAGDFVIGNDANIQEVIEAVYASMSDRTKGEIKYQELVGLPYTTNASIPGHVPADNELMTALREALEGTDENAISTALAAVNSNTPANGQTFTEGAAYAIKSKDDVRGQLMVTAEGKFTNTKNAGNPTVDLANWRFLFSFVTVNGKNYMYYAVPAAVESGNCFVNAFGAATGNSGVDNKGGYSWQIAEVPTAIQIVNYAGNYNHAVSISGGITKNASYEPGMILLGYNQNNVNPIGVLMGAGDTQDKADGTGLLFEYVATPQGYPSAEAMREKVKTALKNIDDIADANVPAENPGEHGYAVNDYTHAAKGVISDKTRDHDYRHNYLQTAERNGINTAHAYQLVKDGTHVWAVNNEKVVGLVAVTNLRPSNEEAQENDTRIDEAKSYWKVVEAAPATENEELAPLSDETQYQFVHTLTDEVTDPDTKEVTKTSTPVYITIDGNNAHTLGTDTIGKVTLGGDEYVMQAVGGSDKATTTSITEVESWAERSEAIYDLQGRRLAAPVKGINIIGGRKVLVK